MVVFWVISGFQLLLLMKTLPKDQNAMEAELEFYVAQAIARSTNDNENASLVSIEERINAFDNTAAKETLVYVRDGINELHVRSPFKCNTDAMSSGKNSVAGDEAMGAIMNGVDGDVRCELWLTQDVLQAPVENGKWTDETLWLPRPEDYPPSERTPLMA